MGACEGSAVGGRRFGIRSWIVASKQVVRLKIKQVRPTVEGSNGIITK